jgi:hypothetical protein
MLWRSYGIAFKERENFAYSFLIYVFHVDVLTQYAVT